MNARIKSSDVNVISRLCNLMVTALAKDKKLPKYIIIVIEDDILTEIKIHQDMNLLGKTCNQVLEWLMKEFHRMTLEFKEHLSNKARRYKFPQFIWIIPPFHINFENNDARVEFATALEVASDLYTSMHALELKKIWNEHDTKLFVHENNCFTAQGYSKYWKAVDATIKHFDIKFNKESSAANARAPLSSSNQQSITANDSKDAKKDSVDDKSTKDHRPYQGIKKHKSFENRRSKYHRPDDRGSKYHRSEGRNNTENRRHDYYSSETSQDRFKFNTERYMHRSSSRSRSRSSDRQRYQCHQTKRDHSPKNYRRLPTPPPPCRRY